MWTPWVLILSILQQSSSASEGWILAAGRPLILLLSHPKLVLTKEYQRKSPYYGQDQKSPCGIMVR